MLLRSALRALLDPGDPGAEGGDVQVAVTAGLEVVVAARVLDGDGAEAGADGDPADNDVGINAARRAGRSARSLQRADRSGVRVRLGRSRGGQRRDRVGTASAGARVRV